MFGLSETPFLFCWAAVESNSLLCQGEYPLGYVYLKGHRREAQDFPENSFVHAHVSKYVKDLPAGCKRRCTNSVREQDVEWIMKGSFIVAFSFWFCLCGNVVSGIKRKWDWIFQVIALLWRNWLIIAVTIEGKLRRLRAEGKTAACLWKGIRPCWKPFSI